MPQLPNLPPVAQAIAVLVGVALAVTRLLTASKAFWWRFPEWLQKGLPAALVAVGLLPAALEHAQSWLDVAQALLLSVGAWFTASRGDQRPVEPPKSKPDDPDQTVRIIPEPTPFFPPDRSRMHNDSPDEPAEFRSFRYPALSIFGGLLFCLGCSAFRNVTPADRAQAYAGQAKAAELACKAYRFDLASGLTPDVPAMTKLCAGE